MGLQYPQNLATSDALHLSNAMRITENDTNLRRGQTLLRKLTDVVLNLGRKMTYHKLEGAITGSNTCLLI